MIFAMYVEQNQVLCLRMVFHVALVFVLLFLGKFSIYEILYAR